MSGCRRPVKPDMKVRLAGMELVNPVIAASGTFGYGIEFEEIVSLEEIGGFVTKGISLEPMAGHAAPRIIQTAAGMLNAIGLQNVGVEDFIERKLPPLASAIPSAKSSSTSSATRWPNTFRSSNGSIRPRASPPTS
jgi:dihydroorotate dehydrogenase (NAD+) catalytic subunit